jgi:hypothetical protein
MKRTLFQRIDENVFKLVQERHQYSTEELQAIWEEDKNGEYVQFSDDGSARHIAHGRAMEEIVPPTSRQTMSQFVGGDPRKASITRDVPAEAPDAEKGKLRAVSDWFRENNVSLNIWHVNERGNIELVDPRTGDFLGGLV